MRNLLVIVLFCSVTCRFSAQESYDRDDSLLWDSPFAANKMVKNKVRVIVVKSKTYRQVRCLSCGHEGIKIKFCKVTRRFEYDSLGYPVRIVVKGCGGKNSFRCKNEYLDGRLVRSTLLKQLDNAFFESTVFTAHYNSSGLPDTCTWYSAGLPVFQRAYFFDSDLRVVQSDVFHPSDGGLKLFRQQKLHYDGNGRVSSSEVRSPAQSNAQVDYLLNYKSEYGGTAQTYTTYCFDRADTVSVEKMCCLDAKICESYLTHRHSDCAIDRVMRTVKKGKKTHRYFYRCSYGRLGLEKRVVVNNKTGLPVRELSKEKSRRPTLQWKGHRGLVGGRTAIVRYRYKT